MIEQAKEVAKQLRTIHPTIALLSDFTNAADTIDALVTELEAADRDVGRLNDGWHKANGYTLDKAMECNALAAENQKLREQAYRLWMLLDDVDTADDVAKADDKVYRTLCHKYQANRWNIMDGEAIDAARAALGESHD